MLGCMSMGEFTVMELNIETLVRVSVPDQFD